MGVTAALGVVTTIALIAFLVSKDIVASAPVGGAVRWGRTLNIGLIPLLIAFSVIVAVKIAEAL
jgi:hypothetical protein